MMAEIKVIFSDIFCRIH